jgi:hypothetical protein
MFTGFEDDEISNILNGLGTDIINDNDNNGSGSGGKKEHICPECGCKF